jgi:hypothetical protein
MKTMRVIRDDRPLPTRKEKTPSLGTLIRNAQTSEEKRTLISQANPLHYAFGNTLTPTSYEEYQDESN